MGTWPRHWYAAEISQKGKEKGSCHGWIVTQASGVFKTVEQQGGGLLGQEDEDVERGAGINDAVLLGCIRCLVHGYSVYARTGKIKVYYTIQCTYEGTGSNVVFGRMDWFRAALHTNMLISDEESLRYSPRHGDSRVLALEQY